MEYETLHKALTQRVDVKANAACEWSIIHWPFVDKERRGGKSKQAAFLEYQCENRWCDFLRCFICLSPCEVTSCLYVLFFSYHHPHTQQGMANEATSQAIEPFSTPRDYRDSSGRSCERLTDTIYDTHDIL